MNILQKQITNTLLPGMTIPKPLQLLFDWIESNKFFVDIDGKRIGFLFPENELKEGWTDNERLGGTRIEFYAEGNVNLNYWFGHEKPEILNRVCVFAQTGSDGSMAAFWLDDVGNQKIVHLGSGSGSTLVCVLADNAVDFLRLLAIGYAEICWKEDLLAPPNSGDPAFFVHPNTKFRHWVENAFSVTIPETAAEIVKFPSEMDDTDSLDPFWRWVEENSE